METAESPAKLPNEFDQKYDIVDEKTPANVPLRGHYKQSFAYYTIRERLPVILTQIVDRLSKDKDAIVAELDGDERAREDMKEIMGGIAKLKYELQTDKKFLELEASEPDREPWNAFLASIRPNDSYFTATWLYSECYMYRRLKSIFESCVSFKHFDYFAKQKRAGLTSNIETIQLVVGHVSDFLEANPAESASPQLVDAFLVKLLKLSLWGNRCDLSVSLGRQIQQSRNAFEALESLDEFLLVDRCASIVQCLRTGGPNSTVDFVLDNSGYELFTDLVLARFLLHYRLVGRVRFHAKAIPWFISDVMADDLTWTLQTLADQPDVKVAAFGRQLLADRRDGRVELRPVEYFWTGPWEFDRMREVRPALYADLAEAHLVVFKGDLNYRKLLADFNWDFGSSFESVLRGFRPTNICSLRTVKADIICELPAGVAERRSADDAMWMETGQFGVVHFAAAI